MDDCESYVGYGKSNESKQKLEIPYFACKINQDGNSVFIPIPYGALENMCRSLLAHNEGTEVVICGIDLMKL